MRIALVTDYYLPTLGGVQTVVKAHREALEEAGHEVTVYAPLAAPSLDPGVVRLPTAAWFRPDGYPFAWPPRAVVTTLLQELRARRTNVVHIHTEMFAALGAYEAAQQAGIGVVQTMHGRVDVYTRAVLPLPAVSTAFLAGVHRRRLSHSSATIDESAPYAHDRIARRMWRLMVGQANAADHVVVPSAHFTRKLTAQGLRRPVTVLSNGLEGSVLEQIGTPRTRTLSDEPLRVMWCGRLSPEKRPEVFVDAVRLIEGIRADMYGDGVSRRRVRRRARDVAAVHIHGGVSQQEVLRAMRDAHVIVSTSWDFDNQPMVLLEAIASGLPVIVTDPDLSELLPTGGHLVTGTPDAVGVAEALRTLLHEPERIPTMSGAMISARGHVDQDVHLDELVHVYRAAIAAHAQASIASRES